MASVKPTRVFEDGRFEPISIDFERSKQMRTVKLIRVFEDGHSEPILINVDSIDVMGLIYPEPERDTYVYKWDAEEPLIYKCGKEESIATNAVVQTTMIYAIDKRDEVNCEVELFLYRKEKDAKERMQKEAEDYLKKNPSYQIFYQSERMIIIGWYNSYDEEEPLLSLYLTEKPLL